MDDAKKQWGFPVSAQILASVLCSVVVVQPSNVKNESENSDEVCVQI